MTQEQIYSTAQVPACVYPAERLLRLVNGLNAMDPAVRRQTIQAIDAADESWTIDDPLRAAAAKVAAIEGHASALRAGLGRAEQQTQARLAELREKLDASVAEIRRQITDLEELLGARSPAAHRKPRRWKVPCSRTRKAPCRRNAVPWGRSSNVPATKESERSAMANNAIVSRLRNLWTGFVALWVTDVKKDHLEIAY